MNVDVDKLKSDFLSRKNDAYNQEVYFVESCYNFPNKYSSEYWLMDLSLHIFFEENNKIILDGRLFKYCDKDSKRKIKLADISDEVSTDINIVNNYIFENDVWEKSQF